MPIESSNPESAKESPILRGGKALFQPIWRTVNTAFESVNKSDPYVSHTQVSPKPPRPADAAPAAENAPAADTAPEAASFLDNQNHAFYIGKLIRQSIRSKIFGILSSSQESLYDENFVRGALEYLVKNLSPGQKAQIVIGPELSEIFNGANPEALSAAEEKKLMVTLAKKMGPHVSDRITITNLDAIPVHRELLDVLRQNRNDQTNEVYLDNVLRSDQPIDFSSGPEPRVTPLKIARCLFMGTMEDPAFMNKIAKGIPGKLKDVKEYEIPKFGYSLTEIAIRLYEIINGRYIHGGASRQAVYDYVITGLLNQPNKHRAPSLQPLLQILREKKFETIHLDTDKNPHKKITGKKRAKRQLLTAAMLGTAVAAMPPIVENRIEAHKEARAEEAISSVVKQRIKAMRIGFERFSSPMNPEFIRSRLEYLIDEIEIRYGIAKNDQITLNFPALLQQFMLDRKELMEYPNGSTARNTSLVVDLFIRENDILLKGKGINIERPYNNLWPYKDLLLKAAEGDAPPEIAKETDQLMRASYDHPVTDMSGMPKKIGIFRSHGMEYETTSTEYALFIYEQNGERFLLAREHVEAGKLHFYNKEGSGERLVESLRYKNEMRKRMKATTSLGRKAAQEWVTEMKRFDASVLYPYRDRIATTSEIEDNMIGSHNPDYEPTHEKTYNSFYGGPYEEESVTYRDSFGAFTYEITPWKCATGFDNVTNQSYYGDCVYARKSGNKTYGLLTAKGVAEQYDRARDNDFWWNNNHSVHGN